MGDYFKFKPLINSFGSDYAADAVPNDRTTGVGNTYRNTIATYCRGRYTYRGSRARIVVLLS